MGVARSRLIRRPRLWRGALLLLRELRPKLPSHGILPGGHGLDRMLDRYLPVGPDHQGQHEYGHGRWAGSYQASR